MESMKRVDVLKGIEQILVQKAYETGHISHRADGDWQKTNNGWVRVKGSPAQSTPQAQEPAPTEFSDLDKYIAKLPNIDLAENSDEVTNVVAEYLADHGIDDNDDDFVAVRSAIMEKLNGDRYGEITEEDLIETPEVDLYNADQVDLSGYANNINIDGGVADNDDLEDVANQILLDNNLEVNDENMNKARDAMLSWLDMNGYLDTDDEEDYEESEYDDLGTDTRTGEDFNEPDYSDDKFFDPFETESTEEFEETKFDSNEDREFDSLQKSITKMYDTGTLKDDISQIPADSSGSDPDEKEVREFVNGLLQMHDMSRSRLTTDHLDSLEEQIADLWHKGQVGKSAVRDMRSAPVTKNMGF